LAVAKGGVKRGWYRDPTGRHDLRRWDGDGWSEWVMDATRRSFDDIDGCGGPPSGEAVSVDGVRATKASSARRGLRSRVRRETSTSPSRAAGAGIPLVPATGDRRRGFVLAMLTVFVATAVALGIVLGARHDVLGALVSDDPLRTLRRYAGPLVVAGSAFEAVLALGLAIAARANPFRFVRGLTGDDLLRGFITFLLALFAWTFLVGAIDGGGGRHWWPVAVGWLFLVEVVVTVVVAPVLEERIFRGYLLAGLRDRFGAVVGVLGQAAIYGAAHAWALRDASRPATMVGMAAVGAVFGWMAHATNDLRPVIVAHAMFGAWVVAERVFGW
jgi:membrane protease YdiL (CAAX protease family)